MALCGRAGEGLNSSFNFEGISSPRPADSILWGWEVVSGLDHVHVVGSRLPRPVPPTAPDCVCFSVTYLMPCFLSLTSLGKRLYSKVCSPPDAHRLP